MTTQPSDNALKQRLDFIELDDGARAALREMRPTISALLGGALDRFYGNWQKPLRLPVSSPTSHI